jgi:hypothetical protein
MTLISAEFRRSITVSCENIDCDKPQSMSFTPSEFEDYLEEGEFNCDSCGEEMSVAGHRIECYICDMEFEGYSLSQIPSLLEERCASCAGREEWDADFYSIRIAGSWSSEYDIYDWSARRKRVENLERRGRTDYWEGLVHFCSAEEFVSIYRERRMRASSTGLYGKKYPDRSKAVCLTETTVPNWEELKAIHGEYGFVFRKKDIIHLKGAPAIYLPRTVIDDMRGRGERVPETLWPYLTKLEVPSKASNRKHDFLHEREWRVPHDILFNEALPYAVTFSKRRPYIEDEELILQAAREFQELSQHEASPDAETNT